MKKLLTAFLIITLVISALAAMPVSAVEVDVAKGKVATGWYNNNGNLELTADKFVEGYGPEKMTDGNDDTFVLAKVNNYANHMLVVDLGAEYDITKIRLKTVTTAAAQAVETANNMTSTNINAEACLFVADKVPVASDFKGANIAEGVTDVVRINTDASNISGVDKTYRKIGNTNDGAALGRHRYVGIVAPFSYGFAVSSLEVYANVEGEPPTTVLINKDVAKGKVATGWYGTGGDLELTADKFIEGYGPKNMTDGNDDTFVFAKVDKYANHMLVVDLGAEYDITKIRLKAVTTAAAKALETANNMVETDVNVGACLFAADKVPAVSDFNGVNIAEGVTDVVRINTEGTNISGIDRTYRKIGNTNDGAALGRHRYVGIFAPFSYGFAVSSLEVWADAESEPPATILVNKDVAKGKVATGWYNSTGNLELTADKFVEGYGPEKMTDGNDDTFVLAKVNNYANHMLVVDLGEEYDITKIRIKAVTTAAAQAVETANSMTSTNVNAEACLFVADKVPVASDFKGANIAEGVTDVVRINTEGTNISGIDRTYRKIGNTNDGAALGRHRYVGIFAPFSYGFAVSSLEVWADAQVQAEEMLVSRNKAVFSSGDSIGNDSANLESNIVDGRAETVFAGVAYSEDYYDEIDEDIMINFVPDFDIVLDLGTYVPISKIVFNPYNIDKDASNTVYTIGGTNDYGVISGMPLPEVTEFVKYTGPADNTSLTADELSGSYRYIVINVKNNGSKSSVIAGIRDIDVYAMVATDEVAKADTRMRRVSRGIVPVVSNEYRYNDGTKLSDGNYSIGYCSIAATSGTKNCMVMDLGKQYPIAAVNLMQIKNNSGFSNNPGFEIIATNTPITEDNILTEDYDVLVSGARFADRLIQKLMYMPIAPGKSYRYIGIRGCSGMNMPFREFDVYTSEVSEESVIGLLNYSIDNTNINFNIYADKIEGAKEYTVLVASYDENGILTKVDTSNKVSFEAGQNKLSGTFENVVDTGSASVKVYVVENLASVKPITVCVGK